jgi:NDP-sugar pyrophosphorylase family protein
VEAILLAGGKAERLGDAAAGLPKALVRIAGKPLAAYQIRLLAAASVDRVIVSCAAGQGEVFERELAGVGVEVVTAEEPQRLGRGGGIRFAAAERAETGDVLVLNGDELLDVDFAALLRRHRETGAAVTITVARPQSPFGLVELDDADVVTGFREGGRVPYWVNCGVYAFSEEGLARLPERGDHETTTFPELVAERRLRAFCHDGLWLTVNTPKDLRRAEEHVAAHPEWLAPARALGSSGA